MSRIKQAFRIITVLFFLLLFILIGNTLLFSSKQVVSPPIDVIELKEEVVTRLSQAIQIPTVSFAENHVDTSMMKQFVLYLENNFPLVHQNLERELISDFSMVFKWEGSNLKKEPVLFLAHFDVVGVEEESRAEWKEKPFSGKIKDEYIWGRGAVDDKMSVLGILEAIELHLEKGFIPDRTMYLAFGHDEEVTGINGANKIAESFKKNGLRFCYILDEGGISISGLIPRDEKKTLSLIGIAEKGFLNIDLIVNLKEAGHAAMPPKETPITILSNAILQLKEHPLPSRMNGTVNSLTYDYMGPEMDYMLKLVFANRWFFNGILEWGISKDAKTNASIRTTFAPTVIHGGIKENVLPSFAKAKINCRIIPEDNIEMVLSHMEEVIADDRVKISLSSERQNFNPSAIAPVNSDGFKVLEKTIHEVLPGTAVIPMVCIGATDSRHYSKLSDNIYRYSPIILSKDEINMIHGINERISIENYNRLIMFYFQLIKNGALISN